MFRLISVIIVFFGLVSPGVAAKGQTQTQIRNLATLEAPKSGVQIAAEKKRYSSTEVALANITPGTNSRKVIKTLSAALAKIKANIKSLQAEQLAAENECLNDAEQCDRSDELQERLLNYRKEMLRVTKSVALAKLAASGKPSYLEQSRHLHVWPGQVFKTRRSSTGFRLDPETLTYVGKVDGKSRGKRLHIAGRVSHEEIVPDEGREYLKKIFPLSSGKKWSYTISGENSSFGAGKWEESGEVTEEIVKTDPLIGPIYCFTISHTRASMNGYWSKSGQSTLCPVYGITDRLLKKDTGLLENLGIDGPFNLSSTKLHPVFVDVSGPKVSLKKTVMASFIQSIQDPKVIERQRLLAEAQRKPASEKIRLAEEIRTRRAWAGHSARLNDGRDNTLKIKYSDDGATYDIVWEHSSGAPPGRCTGKVDPSGDLQEVECSLDVNPQAGSGAVGGAAKIGGTVSKIEVRGWDDAGRVGPWRDRYIAKLHQYPALLERRRSLLMAKRKKAESEKTRPVWASHSARLFDGNDNILNIKYSDDGKTYSILLEYIETLGKSRCSGKVDRFGNLEKVDCSAQNNNRYINGDGRIGGNVANIVFLALDGPGASSSIGPWRDRDIAKRSQPGKHQHIDTLIAPARGDDAEPDHRLYGRQKANIVIVGSLAVEGRSGYLSYRAIAPETGTILAASTPRKVYLGNVRNLSHRKDRRALGGISLYEFFEPTRGRIFRLQKYLKQLGFHSGRVNGYMTSKTRRAIQDYQLHHDLDGTGTVSSSLLKHIRKQVILAS